LTSNRHFLTWSTDIKTIFALGVKGKKKKTRRQKLKKKKRDGKYYKPVLTKLFSRTMKKGGPKKSDQKMNDSGKRVIRE